MLPTLILFIDPIPADETGKSFAPVPLVVEILVIVGSFVYPKPPLISLTSVIEPFSVPTPRLANVPSSRTILVQW